MNTAKRQPTGPCTVVITYGGRERDCVCVTWRPATPSSRDKCACGHSRLFHLAAVDYEAVSEQEVGG